MTGGDHGVEVTGHGQVAAPPDLMVLDAGVESTALTPGEAFTRARDGLAVLREAALAAGVDAADLQTGSLSLHPDYREGRTDRHVVTVSLRIRVRDVDRSGAVIDAISGGPLVRINGIALEHSDPETLRRQARTLAVADARSKAEELAALVGRSLSQCVWVGESTGLGPRPMMARAEFASADMPIDTGSVEVAVAVTTRWTWAP